MLLQDELKYLVGERNLVLIALAVFSTSMVLLSLIPETYNMIIINGLTYVILTCTNLIKG